MPDVINIKKVAFTAGAFILFILLVVSLLAGCSLGASAKVDPPLVTETRVQQVYPPAPPPPIATAYYPAPQLAK